MLLIRGGTKVGAGREGCRAQATGGDACRVLYDYRPATDPPPLLFLSDLAKNTPLSFTILRKIAK